MEMGFEFDSKRPTARGVDCFKYLGSLVAADRGSERDVVHRMNEEYRTWAALKTALSNIGG